MQIEKLYKTSQVRRLDKIAVKRFGIPSILLMKRAGEAIFSVLQERWADAKRVLIFAGKGNNAGDGYVVARLAQEKGLSVSLLSLEALHSLKREAFLAARFAIDAGVQIDFFDNFKDSSLLKADIVIDALLGTGLQGELSDNYKEAINFINNLNLPVISVDVPSGFDADTGALPQVAVKADLTVTFVGAKRGMFTGYAANYCGDIFYHNLGLNEKVFGEVKNEVEIMRCDFKNILGRREKIAHKGYFGHILVVGGDYGMPGAVRMAGEAALRVGAGRVSVVTREEHIASVTACPELMCYGFNDFKSSATEKFKSILDSATLIVLGPGLGKNDWGRSLFDMVLEDSSKPKVIDADGLNLLAEYPKECNNWILTPHPGEAARLLKCSSSDIQNNRFEAVLSLVNKYGGVCVLKGVGTLVASNNSTIGVCPFGNPGMATSGMGDVLSGVIAGLLAQNLSLNMAARIGTMLHSKASDLAVEEKGQRGLFATDLFLYLRKLVNLEDEKKVLCEK